MKSLEELQFDNSYGRLPETLHQRVAPTPLTDPHLISFNRAAAALIDLDPRESERPEFVEYLSGARVLPGSDPLAMCYSGHQFGSYVPRLGDGRAILLGEVRSRAGDKWDLHLKGAGTTMFSRGGDGRAVLRSTVREYLCSEAMHGLGVPTSRALCMFGSREEVYREEIETGALLVRMAPCHVRFGSFEYCYYTNQFDALRELADYVIGGHFPWLNEEPEPYLGLLDEAVVRTARLVAQWQAVGFAHGVMNTDNMSILGLTLDYGPFGFLDSYDPQFICNHSDHRGRYAFEQQPNVGLFNLSCLAQALLPLFSEHPEEAVEKAKSVLERYEATLVESYSQHLRAKLGLREALPGDQELCQGLLDVMARNRLDYTLFFRGLSDFNEARDCDNAPLRDQCLDREAFDAWSQDYKERLRAEGSTRAERRFRMNQVNPKYVLRNYLAENAIRMAEAKDYSEIDTLLKVLQHPYDDSPEMHRYAAPPPEWAQKIVVSCSS